MKRVIVIGAGLGGLAASVRLARAGFHVTVLEKNERVGGKMDLWEQDGYRFDTGPSLLTMPFVVRELFQAAGERIEDSLDLVPMEPICRYYWPDESHLDASGDLGLTAGAIGRLSPRDALRVRPFLAHGEKIYEAAREPFLLSGFGSLGLSDILKRLRYLPAVARIDALRSLNEAVEEYFVDNRIRQLFNRFATYNGSSPYLAPATLSIIPFIEFSMGGWYVRGGMYALANALEVLARRLSVEIRTGVEVDVIVREEKAVHGVHTSAGDSLEADIVLSNADALYAERALLGRDVRGKADASLAGFVLLLGVKKMWSKLAHHTVFFSGDYRKEFDVMFNAGQPSKDPTIYVCNSSQSDPAHAPAGCSNLFVLVNAPPLSAAGSTDDGFDWRSNSREYRDRVVGILERRGLSGLAGAIQTERTITPLDFERHYNAYRGSIYGMSSNSRMAAFLRPPNRSRRYRNLYFVGGSSHPGGGIPLVLLSGKIVADMIRHDHGVL
jgi:phytoene desaturase